jgi:Na+-driven multidrug efflux pump
MVMGACLNVVLDALFILFWHKGVVGAAAATVTAQSVSAFYLFLYYVSGASTLKLRLAAFKPEKAIFSEIFSVGLASFFRSTAMSVVMIFLNRQLLVYGGENAVAALGIMGRLLMLATMPPISLAQGLQPVLGFSYGARNSKRSLAPIKLALLYATGYCVVAFGLIMAFPSALAHIFTSDAKLVETAAQAARLMTLCLSLVGFQVVGSVVFQATGKAVPALVTALSRQVLFLLPLIFLLPLWLGLTGLWLAFPGADFLSFLLTLAFFVPEIRAIRRLKPLAPAVG